MKSAPETPEFDPYYVWLGIPKSEQPPHHYRLLGVVEFEQDSRVIQEAADRQTAHLKTKQTGQRVADSQKLLQQVSAAAGCLLNPESKAKYDQKLKTTLASRAAARQSGIRQAKVLPTGQSSAVIPISAQASAPPPPHNTPPHNTPAPYLPPPAPGHYGTQNYPPQPYPGQPYPAQHYPDQNYPNPTYPAPPPPPQPVFAPVEPASVMPSFVTSPAKPAAKSAAGEPAGATGLFTPAQMAIVGGSLVGVIVLGVVLGLTGGLGIFGGQPEIATVPPPKNNTTVTHQSPQNATTKNGKQKGSNPNGDPAQATNIKPSPSEVKPADQIPAPVQPSVRSPNNNTQPNVNPPITTPSNGPVITFTQVPNPPPATLQDPTAAAQEGIDFLIDTLTQLEPMLRQNENRSLIKTHLSFLRQIGNGPFSDFPRDAARLQSRRNTILTSYVMPLDEQYQARASNRVNPGFRIYPLVAISISPVAHNATPTSPFYLLNGEDVFPVRLREFQTRLLQIAAQYQSQTDIHDRLCYLAAVARTLEFGYVRGNVQQLAACEMWEAFSGVLFAGTPGSDLDSNYAAARDKFFKAAGLGDMANHMADPREEFRASDLTFKRQPDGNWLEIRNGVNTGLYRESSRTPTQIQITSMQNNNSAVFKLTWMLTVQSAGTSSQSGFEQSMKRGAWETMRSSRSLVPRMQAVTPSNMNPSGVVSSGSPGSRADSGGDPPPGSIKPGGTIRDPNQMKPGDRVHIYWGGSWYPGDVLEIVGDKLKIHYDNHGTEWDQVLSLNRVRRMIGNTTAVIPAQGGFPPPNPQPPNNSFPSPSNRSNRSAIVVEGDKKLWRHLQGYIELGSDGTWHERTGAGHYFTLKPIAQTDQYIEFERPDNHGLIRVSDNRLEHSRYGSSNFVEVAKGNWIKPLEELDLEPAQQALLKKTIDDYADALARARKTLLDRFESAQAAARKRTGKPEDRLALMAALEAERKRFEADGLVPWSAPMKQATVDYMAALNRARVPAESTFDRAIDRFVNNEKSDVASALLVLKQRTLTPVVVAKLERSGSSTSSRIAANYAEDDTAALLGAQPSPTIILWSNNIAVTPVGTTRWIAENTGLTFTRPRDGGNYKDKLTFSDEGDSFTSQWSNVNTNGSLVGSVLKSTGSVIPTLDPHERRPEIHYKPKNLPPPMASETPPPADKPVADQPATEKPATESPAPPAPAP